MVLVFLLMPRQVHATMTENYLIGKSLDNLQTLQSRLWLGYEE